MSSENYSYDALPYESHPYAHTHPDHLASKAALFGMSPPDVDTCRVLELGCAGGGNLIPMAVSLPHAVFHGIDLSRRQLEEGWQRIDDIGLENIRLEHRSILDVGPADGIYDYIVCHGVFSWVAPDVQAKIFAICSENLAPRGVAYVSYNTYPGWFLRGMVRQMMCYHTAPFDEPAKKVEQARALLDFLIGAGPAGDETYYALLNRELGIIKNRQDSYLFHEHLEDVNEPSFFHQFIERAEAHALRYLCESQFSEMVAANYGQHVDETLRKLNAGLIHTEQYLDFLCNRTFRRTLLCHKDVELNRQLGAEQLQGLSVACSLKCPEPPASLETSDELTFQSRSGGRTVTVSKPLLKAALLALTDLWPQAAPFEQLPAVAFRRMGKVLVRNAGDFADDLNSVAGLVLELFAKDLVELRVCPLRYAAAVPERPVVSPLARLQAEQGAIVTSLTHSLTQLSDLGRFLAQRLDGTLDRVQLQRQLRELVENGELVVDTAATAADDPKALDKLLEQILESELQSLADSALLLR